MAKNRKSAGSEESVLRDAKEVTAVEQYWHAAGRPTPRKPPINYIYIDELAHLQFELIKLQEWVRLQGLKVAVIFEGRDAAGKGGVIKRITESLNPRICRVVALGTPTERERGQWYFQRYVAELPRRGEIVLFDRSWYNRAGVERVMEFCNEEE
jgi:polyphosphate kinase